MIQRIKDYTIERWPFRHNLDLPLNEVCKLVEECHAEPWHAYAMRNRIWRRHVCVATGWINDFLPKKSSVFEPGCGIGINLFWLAQKGFHCLSGSDISEEAINAGQKIATSYNMPANMWKDDAINPSQLPKNIDAILSVNWLYHIPNASLESFLSTYTPCLNSKGSIIFDMVDTAFNNVKNNQYHSKDVDLPIKERRASEYTIRMSKKEVEACAEKFGFKLIKYTKFLAKPRRACFFIQKID